MILGSQGTMIHHSAAEVDPDGKSFDPSKTDTIERV